MQDEYMIDSHKMHLHPQWVTKWLNGDMVYPIYIEVSPVGYCNHRCRFCAVDYLGYKATRLDTDQYIASIQDLAIHGLKSVMFAGEGEPMLHKDICKMVEATYEAHVDSAFTTNLTVLPEGFKDIMGKVSWIKVSVNGYEDCYKDIHRAKDGDWDNVWDNVSKLVMHKAYEELDTSIGIQCVLLPDNYISIDKLVDKAAMSGVDYMVIKPYSQHKSSITKTYEDITYIDMKDKLLYLQEAYKHTDFNLVIRTDTMDTWDKGIQDYDKCMSTPSAWAYIQSTGDIYACSAYIGNDVFKLGNIHNTLFSTAWRSNSRTKCQQYVDNELDIKDCRLNCRMDKVNRYLYQVKYGTTKHRNFI